MSVVGSASCDEYWMRQAVALARRGVGHTRPNPPVGAVVVRGNKTSVGRGFHRKAGQAHAEIAAMDEAGTRSKGATLYVTLEPCSTWGRTGPCTEAVIRSGVARVVIGIRDPNPKHRGRGVKALLRAGVAVTENVCADAAGALIQPFAKWIATGLPFLTLKLGMSMDGRIGDRSGRSRWITGAAARRRVHELRRGADAILVGRATVERDNPSLRPKGAGPIDSYRVVVDSDGTLSTRRRILSDGHADRTIVATTRRCPDAKRRAFAARSAQVWVLPASRGGISMRALFERLGREGLLHVVCEGGGALAASLIGLGLVDEYLFYVAPLILGGGQTVPSVGGAGWPLPSAPRVRFTGCTRCGRDILLRAVPVVSASRRGAERSACSPA